MTNTKSDGIDPTDPLGAWRAIRDANLDAWAKGMATMANTESFANTLGLQLDTMLAASGPVQKAVSQYMESYLATANMPSRAEVISLAQRMTSIEMRLDDMDARLDEILAAVRALAVAAPAPAPAPAPTQIAELAPAPKPAPRRSRKAAAE